jgi:hypothetical protein
MCRFHLQGVLSEADVTFQYGNKNEYAEYFETHEFSSRELRIARSGTSPGIQNTPLSPTLRLDAQAAGAHIMPFLSTLLQPQTGLLYPRQ